MARRDEREYPSWIFDRGATPPDGPWGLNPPGNRSFRRWRRCRGTPSPLRGLPFRSALPPPKIPGCSAPPNFKTTSKTHRLFLHPINLHGWRGPRRGVANLSGSGKIYLSHWLFASSPLHNPLPALRWRGEETRGAGFVDALEMAHSFEARNGFKTNRFIFPPRHLRQPKS